MTIVPTPPALTMTRLGASPPAEPMIAERGGFDAMLSRPAPEANEEVVDKLNEFIYGSFFKMMMKAMRQTVPPDAVFGGGFAEQVFTEYYDDLLSKQFARQMPDTYGRRVAENLARRIDVKG